MADLEIDGIEIGWGTFFLVHEGYPVQAIYKDNGNTLIGYERLYFFQCDRKGCDNSQFGVLQGQLDDAGGMIRCDICDSVCCDVTGTRLECTCSETVELYPTE